MTDTTPTHEKTFGTDTRPAREAYERAIREANDVRDAALHQIDGAVDKVRTALLELFPNTGATPDIARSLTRLATDLSSPTREAARTQVYNTHDLATAAAQSTRDQAQDTDPFTEFVTGYVTDRFGSSYATSLLNAMPLTFQGLQELAHHHDWCSDYEAVMRTAVRRGALPDDTVEITGRIDYRDVPDELGAEYGQRWEITVRVPAYVRTTDTAGRARTVKSLNRYWVGEPTYRRTDTDKPTD